VWSEQVSPGDHDLILRELGPSGWGAPQVVGAAPGNAWMFAVGRPADHPLRVRPELLGSGDGSRPVLRESTPVRMDFSHSGWSDIFFLAMDYPEGARVSRYAWGDDYHEVVGRMLEQYEAKLREAFPGEEFRSYCDTGPILERAWAQRAGLGWIGKNGCLISQELGSWIFLAVVLTTAELEADEPHCFRVGLHFV